MNPQDLQSLKNGKEQTYLIPNSDYERAIQLQYLEWKDKFLGHRNDKQSQRILLRQLSDDLISKTFLSGFNLRLIDLVIAETIQKHVKMDFNEAVVLAPMVRVTTHPMRLLALRYGATYVYTEEIIDFKLIRTTRFEN
ncbi:unnamed protein product, partial [Rodentolepis nana]|uniref:Restriction endonuclease n=1 Tax=Rodentolepis nana TaxID=102285 RepID=A0A0R3TFS5_RODNA